MAIEIGIATSQEDLIDKFRTFASNNGWTVDNFDTAADKCSIHKGTVYMHMGWDNSQDIEFHQSLGFTAAGTALNAHPNDSGNGGSSSALRSMHTIGNGPFTKHTFFAGSSPTEHLYAVVEIAPGRFRHFGCGEIEKIGDWTGGEFVCCTGWQQSTSAGTPTLTTHSVMMDAGCNSEALANTMHVEGMPGGPASHRWGLMVHTVNPSSNDGDGNGRVTLPCGVRGGPYTRAMGGAPSSLTQGFVPLIRIPCFYRDRDPNPDQFYHLGFSPNIRVINMSAFQPDTTFVQGSDTWHIFPMIRRLTSGLSTEERSGFGGLAYKET